MTVVAEEPAVWTRRILSRLHPAWADHEATLGSLPTLHRDQLVTLLGNAGLTGRGGAGFPTSVKLQAMGRGGVLVANAMESEPLSAKDALLAARGPHLILDGLEVVARAVKARRVIVATGHDVPTDALRAAAGERGGIEVMELTGGFVAGQETALVNQIDGRPAIPRDPAVRITERGVGRRSTLVLNAETLAQVALLARYGADWFRSVGTPADPGSSLFTLSGAVDRPGVVEAARGTALRDVLEAARPRRATAVLLGGYHGTWLREHQFGVRLDRESLAAVGAGIGAGVIHVIDDQTCPLGVTADIAQHLAGESARQCGPCVNGLPRIADSVRRLADGSRDERLPGEIARLGALVTGRGACAHPDGTARLVGSALTTFDDHVAAHLRGWCPSRSAR
jgi:NADH:ubiquinone oxidoreductase subunit F (NADH-binding)